MQRLDLKQDRTVVETRVASHEPPEYGPRHIVAFWQMAAPNSGGTQQSTQQVPNTPQSRFTTIIDLL